MNQFTLILPICFCMVLVDISTSNNYPEIWDDFKSDLIEDLQENASPNYDFFDVVRRTPNRLILGGKKYKKAPTSYLPTCSCGMKEGLLDLGRNYTPRYLLTAICTEESCWMGPYKCKPTRYSVKVLNKTDSFLGEKWSPINVTVACECSP